MQYMLMIYDSEAHWGSLSDADRQEIYRRHAEFIRLLQMAGKYRGGEELAPTTSATCVRVLNGKPVVTDGPYAETKEQFGGYYVIDAKDLDEAISIAARIPLSPSGTIEIRPPARPGA
jgi:hypothetical protein